MGFLAKDEDLGAGRIDSELAKLGDTGERRYMSTKNNSTEQDGAMKPLARRKFISLAALSGAGLASLSAQDQLARRAEGHAPIGGAMEQHAAADGNRVTEERTRRAMLAG